MSIHNKFDSYIGLYYILKEKRRNTARDTRTNRRTPLRVNINYPTGQMFGHVSP